MSDKPGFSKTIKEKVKMMFSLDYPPRKMALACALGMLIGISPYIGLQTYIALAFSTFFRVPVYPLIAGVYLTNPFTIPFIFTLTTKFGFWVLGKPFDVTFDWGSVTLHDLMEVGKSIIVPFFLGTHLAGLILSVFTYIFSYLIFSRIQKNKNKKNDKHTFKY